MTPNTWITEIDNAVVEFVDSGIGMDESKVKVIKRALFYTEYRCAIHLVPSIDYWYNIDDMIQMLRGVLLGSDHKLVVTPSRLMVNIYSNDPKVFSMIAKAKEYFYAMSVAIIDESCWNIKHPKPRNKGKFYHKFSYRFKMDTNDMPKESMVGLFSGEWTISKAHVYFVDLRDAVLFRILHAEKIRDLVER